MSEPKDTYKRRSGAATLLVAFFLLVVAGCGPKGAHTSDARLREIDAMLAKDLPPGTPVARVVYYLKLRAYTLENAGDQRHVRAVVNHIDTKTLEPSAARVTFAFDEHDKLVTYTMEAAPDAAGP